MLKATTGTTLAENRIVALRRSLSNLHRIVHPTRRSLMCREMVHLAHAIRTGFAFTPEVLSPMEADAVGDIGASIHLIYWAYNNNPQAVFEAYCFIVGMVMRTFDHTFGGGKAELPLLLCKLHAVVQRNRRQTTASQVCGDLMLMLESVVFGTGLFTPQRIPCPDLAANIGRCMHEIYWGHAVQNEVYSFIAQMIMTMFHPETPRAPKKATVWKLFNAPLMAIPSDDTPLLPFPVTHVPLNPDATVFVAAAKEDVVAPPTATELEVLTRCGV